MLKWLLGVPPNVGEVWTLRLDDNNPFNDASHVLVKEIRGGWVQYCYRWAWDYQFVPNKHGSERSIRDFRSVFKKVKP